MNRLMILTIALAFCINAPRASAQDDRPLDDGNMFALTGQTEQPAGSTTETTETTTTHDEGFWFWPEPAPLTGKIVTDRPGFSDSAALVPRGRVQIESGFNFTYNDNNERKVTDYLLPQLGIRTGLTDWLEFRVNWAGYSFSRVDETIRTPAGRHVHSVSHQDGCTDINIGAKMPLLKQKDWIPTMSIIPSIYVPNGNDAEQKSFGDVVPEVKLPWNYVLSKEVTVYGSVLGRVPNGDAGSFYQTAITLAGAYNLTDDLSLYVEYLGVYPGFDKEGCYNLLSTGPIYKLTENISLDARVSMGLNEDTPDFMANIGMGIRF